MRLIDADALMENYGLKDATKYGNKDAEQQEHSYSTLMLYEIADIIEDAPTVEAKPVVHGKWMHGYNCSECGWSYMDYADADSYPASGNPLPNFCGNCGADMRKKVE